MKSTSRRIALGAVAALALATMVPGEASAQFPGQPPGGGWPGGPPPGGFPGGPHPGGPPGGWQGGGPRPGGWHGGGPYGGWHGPRRHRDAWVGPAMAGALGGLALGAIAGAANPYNGYGYGPGYPGGCYVVRSPILDPWGRLVGYQPTQVCN
jgi:hypothetical protein